MTLRDPKVLGGLAAVLLVGGLVGSCAYFTWARAAARGGAYDLARCTQMADRIRSCRRQPARAADSELLASQTSALIESAAVKAGIPPAGLVRISPEAPQRVGRGPYLEKPISVMLANLTSRQVVTLLHELSNSPQALCPKSVRLTAPRQESPASTWSAELVLTYLIYQPAASGDAGVNP